MEQGDGDAAGVVASRSGLASRGFSLLSDRYKRESQAMGTHRRSPHRSPSNRSVRLGRLSSNEDKAIAWSRLSEQAWFQMPSQGGSRFDPDGDPTNRSEQSSLGTGPLVLRTGWSKRSVLDSGRYAIVTTGLVLIGLIAGSCKPPATLPSATPVTALALPLAHTPTPASRPTAAPLPTLDSASAWERWDEGLPSFAQVLTLAYSPKHPDTLYAGTNSRPGLWRSLDAGETWQRESPAEESVPHSQPVFTLLWDARRHGWWKGTAGGLYFRPSGSSAWQQVRELAGPVLNLALDEAGSLYAVQSNEGLFRRGTDGSWACIRQDPRALAVGVSSTGQTIFLGTAGNGLWVSHDRGNSWLQVADLQGEYVSACLVDREDGRRVYAGARKRVYRSEDLGRTWQPVPQLGGGVYALTLAPDGTLCVGLKGRIARSHDGGQSWAFVDEGLPPEAAVLDIIATGHAAHGYTLYAVAGDGVYRSTDEGRTWQRHGKGFRGAEVEALAWDGTGGMIAATQLGLYRRPAGKQQWKLVAQPFESKHFYGLSSDAATHTIYAGMERGLVRSTDGGETWEEVISDLTPHGIFGVMVDPDDPDHLFIRLAFERIYESRDGAYAWEALWEGMETHHVVLSMARSPSGELWAGTHDGLFRWDQQAERWQREQLPLPNQSVFAIAFDTAGETHYVGGTAGLWCCSAGSRWRRCAPRAIPHTVTALVVLPGGQLYAGTRYAGLYRSCDEGDTWYQVSGIPADCTVNVLLADTEARIVYVATDRGLFRGRDTTCPQLEPSRGGETEKDLRDWMELANRLSLFRGYPAIRPLPAVHTLRPDDALLQQAKEIGFRAIVQVLSWQEIEPTHGEWHWEYPDFLARATDFYDLDLIVRLDQPPQWAMRAPADGHDFPFDVEAYLKFVEAVAQRYRGQIQAHIIWNEPNLALEWAAPPDPEAYARLLQRAYLAVKRADPHALVVSAGLAPTNEQTERAMDDRVFLERVYQSGSVPCFDALGVHPYGFALPPDDPHGEHQGLNMNRILDLRTIMETHEDGSKPVWATEIGWTTQGIGEGAWLTVTPEEQADYLVGAWRRTQDELPWLEVLTVWNLSSDLCEEDEKAGYSLLYGDGTPKPACKAFREALSDESAGQSGSDPWKLLDLVSPAVSSIPILARDEEVHLGDSE